MYQIMKIFSKSPSSQNGTNYFITLDKFMIYFQSRFKQERLQDLDIGLQVSYSNE